MPIAKIWLHADATFDGKQIIKKLKNFNTEFRNPAGRGSYDAYTYIYVMICISLQHAYTIGLGVNSAAHRSTDPEVGD